jgi:hypothetical protein
MSGDDRDRPKKSWREIDASKDRSSHRKDDRPKAGTRAAQRSSAAQAQYRSALDKLFDGGGAAPGSGWSKVLPEMPKDPATEGRQELIRAVRTATGRAQVVKAVAALLEKFPLPDDPDVLAQVILHDDDEIVRTALEKLDALLPLRTPSGKAVLGTRLRTLEDDPDRGSEVRALAGKVRRKV